MDRLSLQGLRRELELVLYCIINSFAYLSLGIPIHT